MAITCDQSYFLFVLCPGFPTTIQHTSKQSFKTWSTLIWIKFQKFLKRNISKNIKWSSFFSVQILMPIEKYTYCQIKIKTFIIHRTLKLFVSKNFILFVWVCWSMSYQHFLSTLIYRNYVCPSGVLCTLEWALKM